MVEPSSRAASADDPGAGGAQVIVATGGAGFVADQPVAAGGLGLGPSPHELVSAALAACIAQTLRFYAARKAWPLGAVHVDVQHSKDPGASPPDAFAAQVSLSGGLSADQTQRLLELAARCPVHRMLASGARISTNPAPGEDAGDLLFVAAPV